MVGKLAQETFKSKANGVDVKTIVENGRILQIFNQTVNKDNRFGLVVRFEASEILRAAQTYITLVETLGLRQEVLPTVFSQIIMRVEVNHPELRGQTEDNISMTQALDIVSRWLERVADRDPALFRQLMERIKLKRGETNHV
jgi:hypothetical protein